MFSRQLIAITQYESIKNFIGMFQKIIPEILSFRFVMNVGHLLKQLKRTNIIGMSKTDTNITSVEVMFMRKYGTS